VEKSSAHEAPAIKMHAKPTATAKVLIRIAIP
jgi:hypothetical protein